MKGNVQNHQKKHVSFGAKKFSCLIFFCTFPEGEVLVSWQTLEIIGKDNENMSLWEIWG